MRAGDARLVIPPRDRVDQMECHVRAHQQVPALPVDDAMDFVVDRLLDHVPHDPVFVLEDACDGRVSEVAGVRGLPAAAGVEGGPVERDRIVLPCDDGGVELAQVGVAEVEELGRHPLGAVSSAERSHSILARLSS